MRIECNVLRGGNERRFFLSIAKEIYPQFLSYENSCPVFEYNETSTVI